MTAFLLLWALTGGIVCFGAKDTIRRFLMLNEDIPPIFVVCVVFIASPVALVAIAYQTAADWVKGPTQ